MTSGKSKHEPDVPDYFYKYRSVRSAESLEWVRQIICDNSIYYPAPESFNDIFDCRPTFLFQTSKSKIRAEYMAITKTHAPTINRKDLRKNAREMLADPARDLRRPTINAELQDALAKITRGVGVFCLSTVRDDILMWSHYSDCHTGICIEFDGYSELMAPANRVIYALDRPALNPLDDDNLTMLDKALLTKSRQWAYEREWRLIRHLDGPGVQVFQPESITGVIFGANISPGVRETIQGWLRDRPTPVKTYQARGDNSKFLLHIDPLRNKAVRAPKKPPGRNLVVG